MTQMDYQNHSSGQFSEREQMILRLMADGLSNQEIADRLFLALTTVKWYIRQINNKLNTHSRTRTLARARQLKLISDEFAAVPDNAERLDTPYKGLQAFRGSNGSNFVEREALNRLPNPATPFIGRVEELTSVTTLLGNPACRLLTLVGQGGIGKTRLALQAAADQKLSYPHGVYIVPLQSVTSADLIPSAIASALKIMFFGADEPRVQIVNYLRDKRLLLVMDNFEHLLDGISLLMEILAAAPHIKILTTSRERLNMQEEWALSLEGLPFPNNHTLDSLETFDAVQLFVGRARQVQPTFSINDNAEAVKAICQQVEGMPLGIELAVSWLRVMTCQQIAAQMAHSLAFQTTPVRNLPERHRSLRTVFEQSWNLLSANEQAVLMRLSVFRGGFDLEAATAVAGASLTTLANLADKSLIRLSTTGRYDLHELLRQYAADKLAESGETQTVARKHLDYFTKLAEEMEVDLFSTRQKAWLDRLTLENDNLRTALAWSMTAEEAQAGLRLAGALGWFWHILGYWVEGRNWLEKLLSMGEDVSPSIRAYALYHAGDLASLSDDETSAISKFQQALDLARKTGDKRNIAWTLSAQGYAFGKQAVEGLKEALMLFREMHDNWGLYHTLIRMGMAQSDNWDNFVAFYEQALALARQADSAVNIAWAMILLAQGNYVRGDTRQIYSIVEEALSHFRAAHERQGIFHTLLWLGIVMEDQGDYERSEAAFKEGMNVGRELGLTMFRSFSLILSGPLLTWRLGSAEWATRLIAANEASANTFWTFRAIYDKHVAALRLQLGNQAFDKAWTEGKALSVEQAVAYAFGEEPLPITNNINQRSPQPLIKSLSDREIEVLRLMAQGLSNPQIAQHLIVAIGTIKAHTNNIFGKLNVINRVQAVNRAKELHLL